MTRIQGSPRFPTLVRTAIPVLSLLGLTSQAYGQSSVEVLQEFDMEQVRVTDPYYQNLFAKDLAYLLSLDADKLLAGFKAVSQGTDPLNNCANCYGGWEGAWSQIRGHTLGHYLSALAQAYKQTKGTDATNNAAISSKLTYMMTQLASFQGSNGYLFASPESHFDNVQNGVTTNVWVPWYTMHKILAGIIDVYKYTGNATALQIATKLGDWVYNRANAWSATVRTRVLGIEYGGMNDCLYELYKITKNANHLTAAHIFDEDTLFTPISQGTDTLNGKHANTQIPKFIGALNRYRTVGSSASFYYTAAQQFWTIVLRDHTYVTGGNSENELFRAAGQLNATRDNLNNETCNSHNMLKLSRDLFKVSGDVKYADYYERTHLNEILSAINPTNGMTTYFKPMGTGYFKVFGTTTGTFWCCNGTGMENYTKLNDALYFHNATDLYVNQYISSTVDWTDKWFAMSQTSSVPLSSTVTFGITAAPTSALNVKFRKPYWVAAGQPISVAVNNQCVTVTDSGGYVGISRIWAVGDKIQIDFPADVQVSRLADNKNVVAFTYGPVVLSAGLGTQSMVVEGHMATQAATIPAGVTVRTSIAVNSSTTIEDWLRNIKTNLVQTAGKLEFLLKNTDADSALTFTPQYQRYSDRYGIYFTLTGAQGTATSTGGTTSAVTCTAGGAGAGGTASTGGATSTGGTGAGVTGGTSATGGRSATGGVTSAAGTGGALAINTGGATANTGGRSNTGGAAGSVGGAVTTTGGFAASTGGVGTGGSAPSAGGLNGGGGMLNTGGLATGGNSSGASSTGGALATLGGQTSNSNSTGAATNGTGGSTSASTGGSTTVTGASTSEPGSCSCKVAKRSTRPESLGLGLLASLLLVVRRRNRRHVRT